MSDVFSPDLAVAIVVSTELLEEHAGWEVDKNDRCARFVKIADLVPFLLQLYIAIGKFQ